MVFLPVELLSIVVKDLAPGDLRHLRATARHFKDVAEPGAFSVVRITNTSKSIDGLVQLLRADRLRGFVKELEFEEQPRSLDGDSVRYIPPEPVASTEEDHALYSSIQDGLAQLDRFPELESLRLVFQDDYDVPIFSEETGHDLEPPSSASIDIQRAVFSGFVRLSESHPNLILRSFTVENLLPYADECFRRLEQSRLFSTIHTFKLVINDASEEVGAYQATNLPVFYEQSLSPLLHVSQELRSLSLSARAIRLDVDFSGLSFSQLEEISLARAPFDDDQPGGALDFIVRHASTLRFLELVHCSIETSSGDGENHMLWADIWNTFAEKLTRLNRLRIEWESIDGEPAHKRGYCYLESGVGYEPGACDCLEEALGDEDAFKVFAEMIKARDGEVLVLETKPNGEDEESDAGEESGNGEGSDEGEGGGLDVDENDED